LLVFDQRIGAQYGVFNRETEKVKLEIVFEGTAITVFGEGVFKNGVRRKAKRGFRAVVERLGSIQLFVEFALLRTRSSGDQHEQCKCGENEFFHVFFGLEPNYS
jgi:hypothetical protein